MPVSEKSRAQIKNLVSQCIVSQCCRGEGETQECIIRLMPLKTGGAAV